MQSNTTSKPATSLPLLLLTILACALLPASRSGAQSLLERGGVDQVATRPATSRFSLDLEIGVASFEGHGNSGLAVGLSPRFELRRYVSSSLDLALPLLWIPRTRVINECNFSPFGYLGCEFPVRIEEGPSLVIAPSLEWTFSTDSCLRPSIFAGIGARWDRRQSFGYEVATSDAFSPVVAFGFAFQRPLRRSLAWRLEVRTLTTFFDDIDASFPGTPIRAVLDRGSETSAVITLGLHFGS